MGVAIDGTFTSQVPRAEIQQQLLVKCAQEIGPRVY
jgi:hypothetical protein